MTDTALMIDTWLKKNGGARQIEPGASGNIESVAAYLRNRGWETEWRGIGRGLKAHLTKPGHRKKKLSIPEFWRFVDEERIAEGKEPFLAGRAA